MPGKSDDRPAVFHAEVRYADSRWFVVGIAPTADLALRALRALEGSWDRIGHLPIQTRIVVIPNDDISGSSSQGASVDRRAGLA
jgi:hypothetical protein